MFVYCTHVHVYYYLRAFVRTRIDGTDVFLRAHVLEDSARPRFATVVWWSNRNWLQAARKRATYAADGKKTDESRQSLYPPPLDSMLQVQKAVVVVYASQTWIPGMDVSQSLFLLCAKSWKIFSLIASMRICLFSLPVFARGCSNKSNQVTAFCFYYLRWKHRRTFDPFFYRSSMFRI